MTETSTTTRSGMTRARGLGLQFDGIAGPFNAITDVGGVEVGYSTLIEGDGPLVVGRGPIRTGVTAILPRGKAGAGIPAAAGSHALNANGEMTGLLWVEECGECESPITITNTHSCGIARDATVKWLVRNAPNYEERWSLPVAGETFDGILNDINGFHVTEAHVLEALDGAAGGVIELGSVGGGTGMICYEFKGGSGSASRVIEAGGSTFTLGCFVQANFGIRRELTVLGVPVGRHLAGGEVLSRPVGSIIVVIATDAPLLAHQLKRVARRVSLGLARTGSIGHNGSGDIFLALSTANADAFAAGAHARTMAFLPNDALDPVFEATVQATEEAVIDAMIANRTMTGRDGVTVTALPHADLLDLLRAHGRL
ncbi:MAG: P1 family peptidase [Hyphomicrobiales bacterium]